MKYLRTVLVLVLSVALAGAAWAGQGKGKGQSKGKGKKPAATKTEKAKPKKKGGKLAHVPGFGKAEPDKIRHWFRANQSGLPPGLAKRQQLPPGLQRHLERNGTLPPGLQKKVQPLPRQLAVQLPKLPTGYRRYVLGGHVILVEERTAKIVDIIRDVIR
ncbi:MAG: hypothetical protein ACE5MH_10085 [Terriglobia bacterium]